MNGRHKRRVAPLVRGVEVGAEGPQPELRALEERPALLQGLFGLLGEVAAHIVYTISMHKEHQRLLTAALRPS